MSPASVWSDRDREPDVTFIGRHLSRCEAPLRHAVRRHGLHESDLPLVEQDLRIRLWKTRRRDGETQRAVEAGALPWSYLHRTMLSAVRDVRRRICAHHGGLHTGALTLDATPLLATDDQEARVQYHELCRAVMSALQQLAPARRAVVRLHLDGADRRTIARDLGWSEGRVRNLLSRGLADLRFQLERRGVDATGFVAEAPPLAIAG